MEGSSRSAVNAAFFRMPLLPDTSCMTITMVCFAPLPLADQFLLWFFPLIDCLGLLMMTKRFGYNNKPPHRSSFCMLVSLGFSTFIIFHIFLSSHTPWWWFSRSLHLTTLIPPVVMHPSFVLFAIGVLPLVAGHCKITSAKGDLGGKGTALGITDNDGNSQSDVTVFSGGQAKPFGDTPGVRLQFFSPPQPWNWPHLNC